MKRVAARAKVSVTTVSRVVNQSGYVASGVREKVLKAMKDLKYQPSDIARGLRTRSTRSVGVLVPQLAHPYFGTMAIAAEKHLFANGYRTFLCSSEEDPAKESAYIDMLLGQRVAGVMLISTGTNEPNAERLLDAKIPMILVARDLAQGEVDRVLADNFRGAQELVHHLTALGHRRIATLGANARRLSALQHGITKAGLKSDPRLQVLIEQATFPMAVAATQMLLTRADPPTAIMAENDVVAVGIIKGALRAGFRVPEDLSVTGFDDVPLAAYVTPELTTVAQPYERMAEQASRRLLHRILHPRAKPVTEILPTKVVVRRSTAPVRIP